MRAATLLTDALHTASLPFADGGRLVIIRRLPLGHVSLDASPATLALQVEQAARALLPEAVSYTLPSARQAPVVVVRDRGEALVTMAARLASGDPLDDWFWPRIVDGWNRIQTRPLRWRRLLEAAHAGPAAAVVAAAVLNEAVSRGVVDDLLATLGTGDAARWLQAEGWHAWDASVSPRGVPLPRLAPTRARLLARWGALWTPGDVRLTWLAVVLLVAERPARAGNPALPEQVAGGLLRWASTASDLPSTDVLAAETLSPSDRRFTRDDVWRQDMRVVPDADAVFPASAARSAPAPDEDRAPREQDAPPSPPTPGHRTDAHPHARAEAWSDTFTQAAGLLFVVPILHRLRFGVFLAAHPELVDVDLPARLLHHIAIRVGSRGEDALVQLFEREPLARADVDETLTTWTTAVRRWCRRHARQGVITLVRRPGWIEATTTHIDVRFDLGQADVRLRRVALDVDPGWVPWFGRVVQFHYRDGGCT